MDSRILLRYLEIVLVVVITTIIIVGTSTVLSGLVFHNDHSHVILEKTEWTCMAYEERAEQPRIYKEQDCVIYKRKF